MPIMLGISTRIINNQIYLFDTGIGTSFLFTKDIFENFVKACGNNLVVINIMHTNFTAMLPTLKLVRLYGWKGYLGAYPDHGHFVMPHWFYILY